MKWNPGEGEHQTDVVEKSVRSEVAHSFGTPFPGPPDSREAKFKEKLDVSV
jgi:hypothetical protein